MIISKICGAIEEWAPKSLAYDWDRIGLSVGDPAAEATRVMVALTPTEGALAAARRRKTQLLVTHHPLIWDPLRTLAEDNPQAALCLGFVRAGIACYAAHTNLDLAPGGVNTVLAERLGLAHTTPLFAAPHAARQVKLVTFVPEKTLVRLRDAVCDAGAGIIGDYTYCTFSTPGHGTFRPGDETNPYCGRKANLNTEPEHRFEVIVPKHRLHAAIAALRSAHPYEEPAIDVIPLENTDPTSGIGLRGVMEKPMTLAAFAEMVRDRLELGHVRFVGNPKRRVFTAGVMGGSGGSHVGDLPRGVDVYVTGDVDYHDAHTALQKGVAVIDAGHAGTEKWIIPALAAFLRMKFPKIKVIEYLEPELFKLA